MPTRGRGRALSEWRGCPPEGVAGLSRSGGDAHQRAGQGSLRVEGMPTRGHGRALLERRGCPPEGVADHDHVTEGFPPLGGRFKYQGRESHERIQMTRL